MDRLLRYFLQQFIRRGAMTFTTASGARFSCGDGIGELVSVRFLTTDAERRVLLNPELALGEVYMEGTFVVENGSIADALAILMDQPEILPRWAKLQWFLRYLVRHVRQFNPRGRSKNNVAHHYDLDGRLYSSSMPTSSTAAAILKGRTPRWMMPNSPRNAISLPSC